MKGLGRNVRFMMGMFHKCQIQTYLIFFLVFALLNILKENALTRITEEGPFYLLVVMLVLVLSAMGFGDAYYPTMVSFGNARKPAALGMLLSQHVFLLEQMVILFVVAVLAEKSKCMQAIRFCPLGTIALLLFILGIGILINTISLSGHKVCAGIIMFVFVFAAIMLAIAVGVKYDFEINIAVFMLYNNWWLLLIGLVVDLLGAAVYYKTVTKVDLKLA